jgi:hypothetical protein
MCVNQSPWTISFISRVIDFISALMSEDYVKKTYLPPTDTEGRAMDSVLMTFS